MHKVFKFIAGWAKFSINNTIEGLYDLLADESTLAERIGGLFRAMAGLGAAWLGIGILTNPIGTVTAFKNVLVYFSTGLKTAALSLARHPLVLAALAVGALSFTAYELIGRDLQKAEGERIDVQVDKLEEEGYSAGEINEIIQGGIEDAGGSGSRYNPNNIFNPTAIPGDFDYMPKFLNGGYLDGYAKGGWISGPQSGYPVSLDGYKPDFIGHGTEYVATKPDGSAFVVPFDTGATRANPGLTTSRLQEAASMGYLSGGGQLDHFARRMIKTHEGLRLDKYIDTTGNTTIGYGHLVTPNSKIPDTISKAEADRLFDQDYKHHKKAAQQIPGYEKLSLQQKAAMIDLTFNMGPAWYQDFPLMMAAIQKGDYKTAGAELKNSLYYTQVGRRGPVTVALIQNKGLAGVGQYLLDKGIYVPSPNSQEGAAYRKQGFFGGFFNALLGASPAAAGTLDSAPMNDESFHHGNKDGKSTTVSSNLGSLGVIPASHPETNTGWGIKGVMDANGRPVVLSQPGAEAFLRMMKDSKGAITGSDVASSGRSPKKNASIPGSHSNSVHLYGEGLDVSGSTGRWMRQNGARYGWKYGYSHGEGSHHFDYVGPGARKTPILTPFGTKSIPFKQQTHRQVNRPGVGVGASAETMDFLKNMGFSEKMQEAFGGGNNDSMVDLFGGMGLGAGNAQNMGGKSNFFNSGSMKRKGSSYEEQARVRRVTEQRNQARREINNRTTEIVQMALSAVEASNGSNRQFIQTAEAGIRQLLGAQAGGGSFANVGGTTGTVLRTAVAVLNSFNNPLRGIFS